MTKDQLIRAVQSEENRTGQLTIYPPFSKFSKAELEQRLAELRTQ